MKAWEAWESVGHKTRKYVGHETPQARQHVEHEAHEEREHIGQEAREVWEHLGHETREAWGTWSTRHVPLDETHFAEVRGLN